jgi:hypothetical protein
MIDDMEALLALFAIFTPWMMLTAFAQTLGTDSRDTLGDDHQR